MRMPRITIIVPIFNAENYLVECLDSISHQTISNFEVLLVDDGSTDSSSTICSSYAETDCRFKVFSQENAGAAAARNRALDEATGEWVMFVDSDDYLECDCVERLFKAAVSSGAEIAVGGYCGVSESSDLIKHVLPRSSETCLTPAEALSLILYQDGLDTAPWGKIYRRELFDGIRFPNLKSSEDLATVYKTFLKAHSIALVKDSGYRYRLVEGSLSYSEHEVDAWGVMSSVADEILSCFPELARPCCCRRLSFAFHVFFIADDPVVRKKAWSEVVATRVCVLFDGDARKKARLAAAVSFLGEQCAWAIGSFIHFSR